MSTPPPEPTQPTQPTQAFASPSPLPAHQQYPQYQQPYAPTSSWQPPAQPPRGESGATRVIAIVALVLAALACLGVLVVFVVTMVSGVGIDAGGDLEGTAPQVVAGQPYSGEALAAEVQHVFEYEGWSVDSMDCPDTPRVDYDAQTTCHGVVDDYEENVTVDFQDAEGHFKVFEE
ncbi:DUF4333 domain-containing protein [Angustibacter luteus]|uniref:DUF4333 domain-containing protein n=1 Tax=Angustibacter luteus TaxID=658456 RepID=A0ABW1JEF1_9ACTN